MKETNSFLFDTNVIIDALSRRNTGNIYSRDLIRRVTSGEIKGFLVTKQITDIYYVLRKYIPDDGERRRIVGILLNTFEILPLIKGELTYSLNLSFNDYEDAVIYETAKINCVSCIVTNNIKDFKESQLMVMAPNEVWNLQNAVKPF